VREIVWLDEQPTASQGLCSMQSDRREESKKRKEN